MEAGKFRFTDEQYPLHDLLVPEHLKKVPEIVEKGEPSYNEETLSFEIWHDGYCVEYGAELDVGLWIPIPGEEDKFLYALVVDENYAQELREKISARFQNG